MGRQIRKATTILLKCAIIALGAGEQQVALGAEMAMPLNLAAGAGEKPVLVASASQAVSGDTMAAQETRNADDAPAEPNTSALERRSATFLPGSKQRRRKPKMASVPGESLAVQETREPGPLPAVTQEIQAAMPVKPQAVTQEAEEVDPFGPHKPQAGAQEIEEADDPFALRKKSQTVVQQEAKPVQEEAKPAQSGKKFRMAPIRWKARISETLGWLRYSDNSSSSKTFTNVQTAEIKAASYILQPYIAQVNGGIGVVSGTSSSGTSGSTTSSSSTGGVGNSRTNNLFGNGTLSLLSRSRFPFDMSYDVSNSRTNTELTSDDLVSKVLNLRQSYRPPTGPSSYTGSYNNNTVNSKLFGNSAYLTWDGGYVTKLGSDQDQPFNADVRHTKNTNSADGGVLSTNMLTAQHSYLPSDSLLSLNTTANLTQTAQSNLNQPSLGVFSGRFLQANTVASWQPEDESLPLFVNGSGQFFNASTNNQSATTVSRSLIGSLAAIYKASRNLRYNAGGSVAKTTSGVTSNATSNLITTQNGGVAYRSDFVELGNKSSYSWGTNGAISNQTSTTSNSNRTISGGVDHGLNGPYALTLLGKKAVLRYSVNQSLAVASDKIDGQSETLINSGSLNWSIFRGDALSGGANVSLTDTRRVGGKSPMHTLVMLFGLNELSKYRTSVYGVTVDADATVAVVRDQNGRTQTAPEAHGKATYYKQNAFGVRRLSYEGALNVNVRKTYPQDTYVQQYGTGTLNQGPVSYRLDQRLIYRVGQNEVRLTGSLADENGLKNASLLLQFKAWRTIGN